MQEGLPYQTLRHSGSGLAQLPDPQKPPDDCLLCLLHDNKPLNILFGEGRDMMHSPFLCAKHYKCQMLELTPYMN